MTTYIAGGYSYGYRKEILKYDGEDWKKIGELQKARSNHAVTLIDATALMGFCN